MSEDERDVRERLRQHVRERLRLLKEERRRQTRQANASHGEITEVAPDVVEELPTSKKKERIFQPPVRRRMVVRFGHLNTTMDEKEARGTVAPRAGTLRRTNQSVSRRGPASPTMTLELLEGWRPPRKR